MTEDAAADAIESMQPSEPPRRGGARRALIAFLGAALVVLVGVGAVGAFAYFRTESYGDRGASASAMPADTSVYVDVDFGSLSDLDRLLQAFPDAFREGGIEPGLDSLLDRLDAELKAEFGVGVDAVTPWVGRDLGIGLSDLVIDETDAVPEILLAVSVRDGAGADLFITDMIAILEARDGITFERSEYQGIAVFAAEDGLDGETVAVARSDDMLLLANSVANLQRGIDAQAGPSLADDAAMDELFAALGDNRAISVYVSPNVFDELLSGVAPLVGPVPALPDTDLGAFAMSAALDPGGVRLDFVQQIPPAGDDSLGAQAAGVFGASDVPGLLPADTFLYLGVGSDGEGPAIEGGLEEALDQLGPATGFDLADLEQILGFRIEEDLLAHLGGEFGMAVFPADAPIFGLFDAPSVGGMALIGLTNPAAVADTVDKFAASVSQQGLPLVPRSSGGSDFYAFPGETGDAAVFGVAGSYLAIATSLDAVAGTSGDGPKLADAAFFREAADALPTGGEPFLFVDLRSALAAFDAPAEVTGPAAPVRGMVAGGDSDGSISRMTLLTLIDY